MSVTLPPCPYLPEPRPGLDWRLLHNFRDHERGPDFYFACLEYGHALWLRGMAARAILCLDRACAAELRGDETVLKDWPIPYAAMGWFLEHTPPNIFIGNPRVHFQHYADRMREPRLAQRVWRAWACWAIARVVRPEFPNDPLHDVLEPSLEEITVCLHAYGLAGESDAWRNVWQKYSPLGDLGEDRSREMRERSGSADERGRDHH